MNKFTKDDPVVPNYSNSFRMVSIKGLSSGRLEMAVVHAMAGLML